LQKKNLDIFNRKDIGLRNKFFPFLSCKEPVNSILAMLRYSDSDAIIINIATDIAERSIPKGYKISNL